jgi:hypothetical protein
LLLLLLLIMMMKVEVVDGIAMILLKGWLFVLDCLKWACVFD